MRFENFSHVGKYTGSEDLQASLAGEGFFARKREVNAVHKRRIAEAARLMADVFAGREDSILLREAFNPQHEYIVREIDSRYPGLLNFRETMSVTDFSQYLTVDVLDRMLYGYYTTLTIPNKPLVKMKQLNDFRTVKRFELDGGVKPFVKQGSPSAPPEQRALTPVAPITYAPDLYQGMMSVNWRAIINDDLGIFNDLMQRLSSSWNLTIWQAITQQYWDASGPHASLFSTANKNLLTTANGASTNNPPLTFQGLADAATVFGKKLSPDNQPIIFPGTLYLVVPPALEVTANAIKASTMNQLSILGGANDVSGFPKVRLNVGPGALPAFEIIVDKYIPLVTTSGTVANTAWMMVYDPNVQPRPTVEFGMLRGYDTPQLFQRAPNTMRAGGGVDPMMGDFLTMDQDYKAIAVFGSTQVDGRPAVASFGQ